VLDVAENRLNTLPIELGRLHTNLMRLNLEANVWRFPPQVPGPLALAHPRPHPGRHFCW